MNKSPDEFSNTSIFIHSDAVAWREVDGEILIVPIRMTPGEGTGVYRLNRTATFIWKQLDGVRNMETLISELVTRFEVTSADAKKDTRELLGDLLSFNAITKLQDR
ncbi:MAG: PqqD family protein [Deltaproteobacteria bacterium]|nr:PqqD family protein [Deltaproteobacteria bacterium]